MTPKEKSVRPHASISGRKQKLSAAARQELGREAGSGWSARRRLRRVDPRKRKKLLRQIGLRVNPARSGVHIVYNKLLGGWYIVRGPHQTPLGGRFNSKIEAEAHLRDQQVARDMRRNPARSRVPMVEVAQQAGMLGWHVFVNGLYDADITPSKTQKEAWTKARRAYPQVAGVRVHTENFKAPMRRNPARYRGKHPFAIREISGGMKAAGSKTVIVTANNGMRVSVLAKDTLGVMPKLREDIRKYMQPFERSIFENPARSREIVTLTGQRSGHVLGYATPDSSPVMLDAAALRLANAHREPVKIERVKVQSLHASRTMPAPVRAYLANPARRKYIEIIGRKVIFSPDAVSDFKSVFPASGLRDRAYWFEFDSKGDLVDTDVPEHDDGAGAAALSEDAKTYLAGDTQTWMRARSNPAPQKVKGTRAIWNSPKRYSRPNEKVTVQKTLGDKVLIRSEADPGEDGPSFYWIDASELHSNPAPREAVQRAARRFSRFTGHKAERVEMLPFPERPAAGLAVGPVLMLGYSAMRDGKTENYAHKFAPHARPMLVASDDGKTLHILGGHFSFTERGIVDKRK